MCKEGLGKKMWIIPDCELPREGEGILKGHESVIVVNDNEEDVKIDVTIYFPDKDCVEGIVWTVGADGNFTGEKQPGKNSYGRNRGYVANLDGSKVE